jgi:hypothetical protein
VPKNVRASGSPTFGTNPEPLPELLKRGITLHKLKQLGTDISVSIRDGLSGRPAAWGANL